VFDEQKKLFDSVGLQYHYTRLLPESREDEAKIKELNLDREGAIRAGFLAPFEAHVVSIYDGASLMQYRETDGHPEGATINKPGGGSAEYLFDPRCLGLTDILHLENTAENCLGYGAATSVKLIGLESIAGQTAWHVSVHVHDENLEFWIESAHPARVLRFVHGSDMVDSKYDDAAPNNPIPIEVTTTDYKRGALFSNRRFVTSQVEFNKPVDPATWTLAGLGLKVGTPVSDTRISRGIGYWSGTGLADSPPKMTRDKETNSPAAPDRAAQLTLLDSDPRSAEALAAATDILLNTPDGPEVEKAAEVILQYHITSPDLATLAQKLERLRHRCSQKLLEAMLEQNPDSEVRATACFILATLLKDQAEFGKNKEATRAAEKYFEQVIKEFATSRPKGAEFARRSKPELNEIRHFFIGNSAPDLSGTDFSGQPLKLSDYRGKVVVVFFWYDGVAADLAMHDELLENMAQPPLTIGVYCDNDVAKGKAAVERYKITWPSVTDGRQGPIADAWNVHGWLSSYVIDAKGVIRQRNLRFGDLTNAVSALLRE
jgi:peroxiredoxin